MNGRTEYYIIHPNAYGNRVLEQNRHLDGRPTTSLYGVLREGFTGSAREQAQHGTASRQAGVAIVVRLPGLYIQVCTPYSVRIACGWLVLSPLRMERMALATFLSSRLSPHTARICIHGRPVNRPVVGAAPPSISAGPLHPVDQTRLFYPQWCGTSTRIQYNIPRTRKSTGEW